MTLDPASEAWVQRVVDAAPPLSQQQQDLIAAAFAGSFPPPKRNVPTGGDPVRTNAGSCQTKKRQSKSGTTARQGQR